MTIIKTIGEISVPKQWKNLSIAKLSDYGYPVYGANGIIGYYKEFNHEEPTIAITCRGATCGNIHLTLPKSYIASNAMDLDNLDITVCNIKYLVSFLKFRGLSDVTSGAAQPQITRTNLEKVKIPLPPIDDQTKIATLLSNIESLIAKRKKSITDLDELLKSTFLEMFGDPVRNEKNWDRPELRKFGKIITGNTPPRKVIENYSSDYIEWIKTDNISSHQMYIGRAIENLSERGSEKARILEAGALLVVCIAGSIESIGRAALTNRRVAFNQQINAIQPKKDINSFYLYELFKISKEYVQYHATKGMKKILTKGDFQKIRMIKPPIKLQNQFASIVEKAESIKEKYQNSLNDLETLYGALSQKAFKGELDLSRIPLVHGLKPKEITTGAPQLGKPVLTVQDDPKREPVSREQTLNQVFQSYISDLKTDCFSLDDFWAKAEENFMETMDEEEPPLGMKEYDQVKTWLFELLAAGKALQVFNEEENRMEIRMAS